MKYDLITIIRLAVATLLPVVISVVLYVLEKKTKYGKTKYFVRQLVAGLLFGGAAVLATVFGIPVDGAILNVRNAAPLAAGLVFGGPAGIMSGVIGGAYRFFATYWGAEAFSRIACTVGCVMAGLIGAGCRMHMFGNKKPSWFFGLAIGATTEVLHMLFIFLANMNDVYNAYRVVAICAIPMIVCNAISVMLSLFAVALIGKERTERFLKRKQISQVFQLFLMICVVVAFAATTVFTYALQTKLAYADADELLSLNLDDVGKDVKAAVSAGGNVDEEIMQAVANRHIMQKGGIIVCDKKLKIIGSNGLYPEGQTVINENKDGLAVKERERFTATVNETELVCMYEKVEDYYLIAVIPVADAMLSRNMAVTILDFMEIIVFAALFAHIYFLLKKLIVDNIHKINDSLDKITDGNLEERVNVRENEEFASLSDDINATVDTLKRYIQEAEGRIDRELEFARQIQRSSLPSVFPPYPDRKEFDIYAQMDAAKEVGGDFYDFYFVDSDSLAFLVADVSGKGIPAALFMMRAKTLIKSLMESGKGVDEAFTEANNALSENNEAEMFVTAWLGKLNLKSGVLEYVNAGHNPPLFCHCGGGFKYLKERPNFVLAGMDGTCYRKHEIRLNAGDEIFLYTDGVTEASNDNNELYGEKRLVDTLNRCDREPSSLSYALRESIIDFVNGAEQSDDITTLCVRFNYKLTIGTTKKITVAVDDNTVKTVAEFIESELNIARIDAKITNRVLLSVDEILSNVVSYSGAKIAEAILTLKDDVITMIFSDDGKSYDPTAVVEPDVTLSAEERKIGGLGIFMVKKTASSVIYSREEDKNVLTINFTK